MQPRINGNSVYLRSLKTKFTLAFTKLQIETCLNTKVSVLTSSSQNSPAQQVYIGATEEPGAGESAEERNDDGARQSLPPW
jgi:hypothetical protein